jgi:RNA polymerase sigma factor (sigma-70 family)
MSVSESDTGTLAEHHPDFLDLLDQDPKLAFGEFYAFARRMFEACPPRSIRMVHEDLREDLIHDIIVHCCEDDFRVLRTYRDQGRPFVVWFNFLSRNKIIDWLKKQRGAEKEEERVDLDSQFERVQPGQKLPPDRDVARRALLQATVRSMDELGERCRLLLLSAAEGLKPREMARFLGSAPGDNKKISDALRECRRQLRYRLRQAGINPESVSIFMESLKRKGAP